MTVIRTIVIFFEPSYVVIIYIMPYAPPEEYEAPPKRFPEEGLSLDRKLVVGAGLALAGRLHILYISSFINKSPRRPLHI